MFFSHVQSSNPLPLLHVFLNLISSKTKKIHLKTTNSVTQFQSWVQILLLLNLSLYVPLNRNNNKLLQTLWLIKSVNCYFIVFPSKTLQQKPLCSAAEDKVVTVSSKTPPKTLLIFFFLITWAKALNKTRPKQSLTHLVQWLRMQSVALGSWSPEFEPHYCLH